MPEAEETLLSLFPEILTRSEGLMLSDVVFTSVKMIYIGFSFEIVNLSCSE